jgi:putative phosphoesterase
MRRTRISHATVDMVGDTLRVVAVADTHSKPHPKLGERIAALAPHHIFHAGDVGDLAVLGALRKHAPVTVARGNIDALAPDLPDVVTIDVARQGATVLTILLVHIAVSGLRLRADVRKRARAEDASLVVCGHSHVPFATDDDGVAVFNPGSAGPRRFALPIVFGVIDIAVTGVSLRHVDCETGLPWQKAST